MKAHLAKPTAESIHKFHKRMETQWSNQKLLDDMMIRLITMSDRELTVPQPSNQTNSNAAPSPKSRQTGLGYVVWRENAQLLKIQPSWKIPVPEDMEDLRNHVDNVLEPLLQGLWHRQTRDDPWWDRMTDDYPALGRAWAFSCHIPERWAGDEIASKVEALNKATDESEIKRLKGEIYKLKQGKLPISTRRPDPRCTWSYFDSECWLPQVIEVRELSVDAAKDEYGEENVPDEYLNGPGTSMIKCVHYSNHKFSASVLCGSKEENSKFVKEPFEHGLNRNPYLLFEADLLPDNNKGWRWAGLLFHAEDMLDTIDQIITDLAWIHHEWTLAPIVISHDVNESEEDTKTAGRPPKTEYGPGKQIEIWNTEEIKRGPVPEIPQQSIFLLLQMRDLVEKTAMVPAAERGELKAGTSNNAYSSQIAVSQRRARGVLGGMGRFAEAWAAVQFCAIYQLLGSSEESISVFSGVGKKGLISASSKDVRGYEEMIVAIIDQPIEIDEYTRWLIGGVKVEKFGFSPEQVVEEMGYPNPEAVTKRGWDYRMDNATFQVDYEAMLALSGQKFAQLTPAEGDQLTNLFENADPNVQAIVARLSGGQVPSPNGQAESNVMRAQAQQLPQQPVGPVTP